MSGTSTAYRLVIEGLGIEAVTDPSMEQALADGRVRVRGLLRDGLTIEEEVAIAEAEVEASPLTAQIVDRHPDDVWTTWLAQQPQSKSWLTADVAASGAVNVDVKSTTPFSAGDVIHVGTEAMLVDTVASGTRLTVASGGRGYWDTIAQAHYTGDGAELRNPVVSLTYASTLEGRRAYLYRYELGDDLTGNGTLIWRGVCSTDAELSESGHTWSIVIDPITRLLKQDLGSDLDEPTTIRGVFYSAGAPLDIGIYQVKGTARGDLDPDRMVVLKLSGFWETQEAFCEALTDAIQEGVFSSPPATNPAVTKQTTLQFDNPGQITAVVTETGHWAIQYPADSSGSQVYLVVRVGRNVLNVDGELRIQDVDDSGTYRRTVSGYGGATGQGLVPRAVYGPSLYTPSGSDEALQPYNLYLQATGSIGEGDRVHIEWGDDTGDPPATALITNSDTSEGWVAAPYPGGIGAGTTPRVRRFMYPGQLPTIRIHRSFGRGTLATFRDQLVADGPTLANIGGAPFLTSEDLADWSDPVAEAAAGRALAQRDYIQSQSVELNEMLAHECRLIGVYPTLDSDGKISLTVLRLPTATSIQALQIDASNILVDEQPVSWQRSGLGVINVGVLKTQYSHEKDDHLGVTWRVRDVSALSTRKLTQTLEVAPMSVDIGPIDKDDAVGVFSRVLGIFGRPYSVVRLQVPATLLTTALVGTAVGLSTHRVPDITTGTRGVGLGSNSPVSALIVGRSWDLARDRGDLTLLLSDQQIAGYAPSLQVTGSTNVSGAQYDLDVTFDDFTGSESMAPSGAVISDFFTVGDELELVDFDDASASRQACEVDDIDDGAGTIRVTFDVNPPSISGEQFLMFADADEPVETAQQLFAFYADSSAEVDFGSVEPAREYSA